MELLTVGVLGASHKENEHRLPIHPEHISDIEADLRSNLLFESGYGERYGVTDELLRESVELADRGQILAESDVLLLPKPTLQDLHDMCSGQVLWGWPHCVQDAELTQQAIDKNLTLIAWEAMNHWTDSGTFVVHVFHINNELAGYASVLHALSLKGTTGHYGRHLSAAVIGFGNTARGAITALQGQGVYDITVLTMRDPTAVASPVAGIVMVQQERRSDDPTRTVVHTEDGPVGTAAYLGEHDIIVNCVLQDTDEPVMFVTNEELDKYPNGRIIVDVSCDEGMGFECALPTNFDKPTFEVGHGVTYYAVDHSPSHLWNSATWSISEALLPYLRSVMSGPTGWDADLTIQRAIEIRDGRIQNPKILSFQQRSADHPHPRLITPDGIG